MQRSFITFSSLLSSSKIPVPEFIQTNKENIYYFITPQEDIFAIQRFVEDGIQIPEAEFTTKEFVEVGKLAARIQNTIEIEKNNIKEYREYPLEKSIEKIKEISFEEINSLIQTATTYLPTEIAEKLFSMCSTYQRQFQIFIDNYQKIKQRGKYTTSFIHNDLHSGNLLFNQKGKIVALLDPDMSQKDYRVREFNNMVITHRKKQALTEFEMKFVYEEFMILLAAYQKELDKKLTIDEIKLIIEILRLRFIEMFFFNVVYKSTDSVLNPDSFRFNFKRMKKEFESFQELLKFFPNDKIINEFARLIEKNASEETLRSFGHKVSEAQDEIFFPESLVIKLPCSFLSKDDFIGNYHNPRKLDHFDIKVFDQVINPVKFLAQACKNTLAEIKYPENKPQPLIVIKGSSFYLSSEYATDFDLHLAHLDYITNKALFHETLKKSLLRRDRHFVYLVFFGDLLYIC